VHNDAMRKVRTNAKRPPKAARETESAPQTPNSPLPTAADASAVPALAAKVPATRTSAVNGTAAPAKSAASAESAVPAESATPVEHAPPPPRPLIRRDVSGATKALVLQGGGAMGAYQAGVFEVIHAKYQAIDWVAGVSIGAINGALIAGNPPGRRLEALREFWRLVSSAPGQLVPRWGGDEQLLAEASAGCAMLFGPRIHTTSTPKMHRQSFRVVSLTASSLVAWRSRQRSKNAGH
jgi:NTE family protein